MPFAPPTYDVPGLADIRTYLESRGESVEERTNAYTQGWWTFEVFAEGVRRVLAAGNELSGENIRSALEEIRDFDTGGVTVPIAFSPDDHRGSKGLRLYRIENGAWIPATEFRTAPERP
jgi:branched-chain amino acid transport system substrate-binding protein